MELAAAIASLSCKAFVIANDLYELHGKYKDAGSTIDAICHEVEVVRASVSRAQRLLEKDSAKGMDFRNDLRDVFDMAITGCTVVLSCLDREITKLLTGSGSSGPFGWRAKAKYLWKEETMMDLLQRLRGQQGAISLLFQSLQMESLSELHHLLQERAAEMNLSQAAADSLRKTHPHIIVPCSLFNDLDSERGSIISNTEFSFNDELINSKAYRRALSTAHRKRRLKPPGLVSVPESSNDGFATEYASAIGTNFQSKVATSGLGTPTLSSTPTDHLMSPNFTEPPPAYEPALPPLATCATTISRSIIPSPTRSISSPLSITLPPTSLPSPSSSSAPTTPTGISSGPSTDTTTDPLCAAIARSLASFKLRALAERPGVPNRPSIPQAPRLDPTDAESETSTPSSPSSDRPPSSSKIDNYSKNLEGKATSSSPPTRKQIREKAQRRAQEKRVERRAERRRRGAKGMDKIPEGPRAPSAHKFEPLSLGVEVRHRHRHRRGWREGVQ